MVATVVIKEITGPEGSPTYTTKDDGSNPSRYYTADLADSASTSYPIPIPDTGTNRSYWKTHFLDITSAPDTYIKNVKYYQTWSTSPNADWALGTNGDLVVGISSSTVTDARILTQGFPTSSYDQATGTQGTTGDGIASTHSYYSSLPNGQEVSITNFDSQDNALMVQSGQVVGNSTGESYCVVTQVIVGVGATQGSKADKTATWVYDEA